jgi:hypothetical protein
MALIIKPLTPMRKAVWAAIAIGVVALAIWLVMFTPLIRMSE